MRVWGIVVLALTLSADAGPARAKTATTRKQADVDQPYALGPRLAPVTAEVFCPLLQPSCAQVSAAMRELAARHPKRLRVVFRMLALPANNAEYELLSEAALEAAAEGRFFEFEQAVWTTRYQDRKDVGKLGAKAGLDATQLAAALGDHRFRAQVERDSLWAERLDVTMSPAVVWNGTIVTGVLTVDGSEAKYDEAYGHAKQLLDDGVAPEKLYARLLREAHDAPRRPSTRLPGVSRKAGAGAPEITAVDLDAPRFSVPIDGSPTLRAGDGERTPDVTIVVFADFQCPHCRHLIETLTDVVQAYPGQVQLVFKHAPVDIHRAAEPAAEAAVCAQRQGKFWELAALLFANQQRLAREDVEKLAKQAGLDLSQLTADLDGGRCDDRVAADIADAKRLGLYGTTPVVFVNGLELVGDRPFVDFRVVVDAELSPGLLSRATGD